jgi:hypothetical protein
VTYFKVMSQIALKKVRRATKTGQPTSRPESSRIQSRSDEGLLWCALVHDKPESNPWAMHRNKVAMGQFSLPYTSAYLGPSPFHKHFTRIHTGPTSRRIITALAFRVSSRTRILVDSRARQKYKISVLN